MEKFYYKIQSEVIKDLHKNTRLSFGENEDEAFLLFDTCAVYLIPKEFNVLNFEKIKTKCRELKSNFIDNLKRAEYKPAIMTGYIISSKGDELATLISGDLTVYINKKMLKLIPKEATYNIVSERQPVEVKLGEKVIAYVCPTLLPKE